MATEAKRGCGYRKAGGIYLRGDLGAGIPVDWLPCCVDYPYSRGLVWADPRRLFATAAAGSATGLGGLESLLALEAWIRKPRVGLIWVGAQHYDVASFTKEAMEMGVSRRVGALPQDVKPGDPMVLAFVSAIPVIETSAGVPEAIHCSSCSNVPAAKAIANWMAEVGRPFQLKLQHEREVMDLLNGKEKPPRKTKMKLRTSGDPRHVAGAFHCFTLTAIEVVLPASVASDPKIQERADAHGVEIVSVPDDDKDHVEDGWRLPSFLEDDEEATTSKQGTMTQADFDTFDE